MSKSIAILGSSRPAGNTYSILQQVIAGQRCDYYNLADFHMTSFDYDGKNLDDDFITIANAMSASQRIILATPVYWYAMSAQLKVFVDRLSDLITRHKPLGRSLAGKQMFLVASGSDAVLPEGFTVPFSRSAAYFSMEWKGCLYGQFQNDKMVETSEDIETFQSKIFVE